MFPERRPHIPKLSEASESKIVALLAETLHRQPTPSEVDAERQRLFAFVAAVTAIAKRSAATMSDQLPHT